MLNRNNCSMYTCHCSMCTTCWIVRS